MFSKLLEQYNAEQTANIANILFLDKQHVAWDQINEEDWEHKRIE